MALVPTMGALHEGHLALVRRAKKKGKNIGVSIFVNPRQFGAEEDFGRYPRPLSGDIEKLAREGVDWVYAPPASAIYPPGFRSEVRIEGRLTHTYEGMYRPGHFNGVTTVLTKLFSAIRPDIAVFGDKDLQQLAVVRRLVHDLNLGIQILSVATVRARDGLALSSRNNYLNDADRSKALGLYRSLTLARNMVRRGMRNSAILLRKARESIKQGGGIDLQYLGIVHESTFEDLARVRPGARMIVAATVGGVHLIDNIRLYGKVR